ncbi:Stk1 family PASTA domain-containing Ser/Thr kinase [Dellaglioa algida]|uniref:Stk1 family PASTA domain-containing Ser/Thr kinase n=1 Tax=Dellaglioa algida TaxID=105612 RepID=UPI0024DE04B1|nr:Stk1 family PASTA domain-containing Ser/Thr kinase [Dellaglioa algida]MDK1740681.1 Stk1 family PASTA domain-containing Ser/Thr kinase [Dellaglioa algida]
MKPDMIFNEHYRIIKSLGEGGMANVYLATDLILDRPVAVKVLRVDLRDDQDTIRRFKREALATTELVHPNIVSVYDVGEVDGFQYMVMEYVAGYDLKTYITKQFPIPYQVVIDIMTQILSAVEVAHDHNIIHRDLKPQNILIDEEGNAKITDFGIAVALADHSLTQTNTLLGSVHYLSPEQARGSMATKRSDIYSLGIILYEMLTGKVPFEGETAVSIALKHFQSEVPSVREFDPNIPQSLENIVLQATSKVPQDRFQSAEEMSIALSKSLSQKNAEKWYPEVLVSGETKVLPVLDKNAAGAINAAKEPEVTIDKKKKMSRRKKWTIGVIMVALLMLIVGGVAIATSSPKEVKVPDLSGMTISEAKSSLADKNLKLGKVTRTNSETVSSGDIINSAPKKNETIREENKVDVIVSKGKSKITVENYVGSTYSDVKSTLEKDGFTVEKETQHSDSVTENEIMEQDISAGDKVVPSDTVITLTVSSGPEMFTLRDLSGYTTKSVQDYATEIGARLSISEAYSNSVEKGQVVKQSPSAGSNMSKGGSLSVTISKGKKETTDEFTRTVTVPFKSMVMESSSSSDKDKEDSSDESSNSSSSSSESKIDENVIEVYIEDKTHSIDTLYERKTITKDTDFKLSFIVDSGKSGKYKILRDDKVIAENGNVTKN